MRAICRVQLKDVKTAVDLMLMLGLNEGVDQLSMADSVRWYGHVLRMTLDLEVRDHRTKGRPRRTWKQQVEDKSVKVGLRREDAIC